MSQFFGQNAEVCAIKKLTSDVCRKFLIIKCYQAYEIKTGGEISSHVHFKNRFECSDGDNKVFFNVHTYMLNAFGCQIQFRDLSKVLC